MGTAAKFAKAGTTSTTQRSNVWTAVSLYPFVQPATIPLNASNADLKLCLSQPPKPAIPVATSSRAAPNALLTTVVLNARAVRKSSTAVARTNPLQR